MSSSPKRLALASSLATALAVSPLAAAGPPKPFIDGLRAQVDAIEEASVRYWFERHGPIPPHPAGAQLVTNCRDDGSRGTLRSVMESAVSGDTIDLSHLTCSKITLTQGKIQTPFASSYIAMVGPGMDLLTISGDHKSQIIDNIGYGNLKISDMSFTDGYANDTFGGCLLSSRTGNGLDLTRVRVSGCEAHQFTQLYGGSLFGGGIFTTGALVLTDSIVTGNTLTTELPDPYPLADGLCGGGAGAFDGPFYLTRSTVSYNEIIAPMPVVGIAWGGGLCVAFGYMSTITKSVISNNTIRTHFTFAPTEPSIVAGGGFLVVPGPNGIGPISIVDSTIADNVIENAYDIPATYGGGLATSLTTAISGTTISGNSVTGYGGGVLAKGASISIVQTTVSGNHAELGGGAMIWQTGTVDNSTIAFNTSDTVIGGLVVSGDVTLRNSLISGNTAKHNPDIGLYLGFGTLSGDHNFVGVPGVAGELPDTLSGDPQLGPLANNGGPTLTHAIDPGSPACDVGSNPLGLPFDQRGPGFTRSLHATDIGAFEYQSLTLFANGFDP